MQATYHTFKKMAAEQALAGKSFFDSSQPLRIARAPGRLDVMGGIADYSGSLVLEMPIAEATWAATQPSNDKHIYIRSLSNERHSDDATFSMHLNQFLAGDDPISYTQAATFFQQQPKSQWASYIGGTILVLMREKQIKFNRGLRIFLHSNIPEGKGVSSSAAVEVAAMLSIATAMGVTLAPNELARLCQLVENRVADAPCGIMDQMTVVNGRKNELMALLCQPATIQSFHPLPAGLTFWGIDSGIRHAVSGADYGSVRVGAFMGLRILQTLGVDYLNGYLANMTPSVYMQIYRQQLPERLLGKTFLQSYGALPDVVTTIDPERIYAVRQPTAHPVFEHFRVQQFANLLQGNALENSSLLGELMYQSHASYSACGLGADGTDRLVELVREAGPISGLFGAKISGGGSGGTVVVLGTANGRTAIDKIAAQYQLETNHQPYIFEGSSSGARVFDS